MEWSEMKQNNMKTIVEFNHALTMSNYKWFNEELRERDICYSFDNIFIKLFIINRVELEEISWKDTGIC